MTSPVYCGAITARPEQQRRLLSAMAVCVLEGFWLALPEGPREKLFTSNEFLRLGSNLNIRCFGLISVAHSS
jgi:hypothetical protein